MTSSLPHRIWQHRHGKGSEFTRRHNLHRFVYAEPHDRIEQAIQREKLIKSWPRAWKVRLITANNPNWDDLDDQLT